MFFLDDLPAEARKYIARDRHIVGGGCGANAAVAIARLGGEARLVTRLGDDAIADMILADLEAEGVNTELTDRSGAASSCSSILMDAAGERQIVNFRKAGLREDTGWFEEAPDCAAVLTDTRWPAGARAALALARKRGIPGVVDGEGPINAEWLEDASHIAFSANGLSDLFGEGPDALARARERFGCWVCVTDGARGVRFDGPDGAGHLPAFEVHVVDTTGAGDVWHGAFALRLGEGADEVEAIRFANAVAALKCASPGGRAGTPTRAAVEEFMREAAR